MRPMNPAEIWYMETEAVTEMLISDRAKITSVTPRELTRPPTVNPLALRTVAMNAKVAYVTDQPDDR